MIGRLLSYPPPLQHREGCAGAQAIVL